MKRHMCVGKVNGCETCNDIDNEVRTCDDCGALCDMRIAYCECDPVVCKYPPVQ